MALPETWSNLMETNDDDPSGVSFRTYFSYDSQRKRHLHYLLKINDTLFIVHRKSLEERSELILRQRFEHVIDCKVVDEGSTGRPLVHIYNLDGSHIQTNFLCESTIPSVPLTIVPETKLNGKLSKTASLLGHQLHMQKQLHQKLIEDVAIKLKFGPQSGQENSAQLVECLVRYGDPWKRIHNDQLVIGVPLLNSGTR